jgi:hypothetical protein
VPSTLQTTTGGYDTVSIIGPIANVGTAPLAIALLKPWRHPSGRRGSNRHGGHDRSARMAHHSAAINRRRPATYRMHLLGCTCADGACGLKYAEGSPAEKCENATLRWVATWHNLYKAQNNTDIRPG